MSAIYAIVEATSHGWISGRVLGFGGARRGADGGVRRRSRRRIENPIMPLRILRLRGLVNASLVRGFLVTGMYSTFFLGTLYLEHVRHYSALQTGPRSCPGRSPSRCSRRASPRGWSSASARSAS